MDIPNPRPMRMSAETSREAFQSVLNSEFLMQTESDAFAPMVLTQCQSKTSSAQQECFALLFQAPPDAPNEQRIFSLSHSSLGPMEIFLVPVNKNEKGLVYEAIFNRLLS